ncbi:hypothetical protein MB27_32910 [Actinoplanes utahensis]|uniref:Ankyrin n=1 Tax=Actinoplanes utahensis TaxID=1869 RepID=A0A0A6UEE5_ACTUT|nr:hypothetical protein MB27_32910 [Actinoplanes utahensis]
MRGVSRYEIHLTVFADASDDLLRSWAAGRGVKYTRIMLDRGDHASQPMLSWLSDGTPASAEADARRTADALRTAGFPVTRLKVEAAASGREAPATAADARPDLYFEHHVKLLLPAGTALEPVRAAAAGHDAHLSRNARRVRADGVQERFVTQRCYRAGQAEASAALAGLLGALSGWEVTEVEQEYVLVDDNPGLDAGWFA